MVTKEDIKFLYECIDDMIRHLPDFLENADVERIYRIMKKLQKEAKEDQK